MGNSKLMGVFQTIQKSITKHSPEILMGLGVAGMLTTTVLAVKATPKALRLIEERKKEEGTEKLSAAETVKTTYKCYLPAAGVALVSTGCLIGSASISVRRNAALATAYKIVETGYKEYKEQVIETLGEKKEELIREAIIQKKIDENPVSKNQVIVLGGDTLCYDVWSGRYFRTDIDKIKRAINELNRNMTYNEYVSLNDFYDLIGLETTKQGELLGWKLSKGLIELDPSSHLGENDQPAYAVDFVSPPEYDYYKFM
jgi:hypothetical protein